MYHAVSATKPPSHAASTARGSEKKPRSARTPASTTLTSPSTAAAGHHQKSIRALPPDGQGVLDRGEEGEPVLGLDLLLAVLLQHRDQQAPEVGIVLGEQHERLAPVLGVGSRGGPRHERLLAWRVPGRSRGVGAENMGLAPTGGALRHTPGAARGLTSSIPGPGPPGGARLPTPSGEPTLLRRHTRTFAQPDPSRTSRPPGPRHTPGRPARRRGEPGSHPERHAPGDGTARHPAGRARARLRAAPRR